MSEEKKDYKFPVCNVFDEKEIGEFSRRQVWYKKRNHCINECKKCDEEVLLKKIYWELRKGR